MNVEIDLPSEPKLVWRALTEPDALTGWMMPVEDLVLEAGRRFRVRAKPAPGWDGIVNCELRELDEPHELAYTWQGAWMHHPTMVIWTLEPLADGGTRLRLRHHGFRGVRGTLLAAMHGGGWRKMLNVRLRDYLAR